MSRFAMGMRWTRKRLSAEETRFMNDVQESLLAQRSPGSLLVIYLILAVFIVGAIWAHFARVEEITQGRPGSFQRVVSRSFKAWKAASWQKWPCERATWWRQARYC